MTTTPAAAVEPCEFVEMQTVAGGSNLFTATDRTGRYQIGVRAYWDEAGVYRQHLIRWRDGVAQLGPRLDTIGVELTAVGPTGVAAGYSTSDDHRRAAAYAYGQVIVLSSPSADRDSVAVAVNGAGQLAGSLADTDGAMARVLVWSADGEVAERANPAGFRYAEAKEIDDDGTVLGVVTNDPVMYADSRIAVWSPGGSPRLLEGTRPADPDLTLWPVGIRDGKVVGRQSSSAGVETLQWDLRGGPTQVLPIDAAEVFEVNAGGAILAWGVPSYDGWVLQQGEVIRQVGAEGLWITPRGLTDDNRVYGQSNSSAPAYFDCG